MIKECLFWVRSGPGSGEPLKAAYSQERTLCLTGRLRHHIEAQGAAPNTPDKSNRTQRHCFSKALYKERNSKALYKERNRIERFFNRIKHYRRVATRFEKQAAKYLAMIKLAAIRIWLRVNESMA